MKTAAAGILLFGKIVYGEFTAILLKIIAQIQQIQQTLCFISENAKKAAGSTQNRALPAA